MTKAKPKTKAKAKPLPKPKAKATTKAKPRVEPEPEPQAEPVPKPKFSLEKALKAISERAKEIPAAISEGIGRVDPNTPEVKRRRVRQLEVAVLNQIEYLQTEPDSELKTTRLNVALDRLGELRAEMGDYVGAIEVTHNPKRAAHYEKVLQAIERDNNETCDCPTFQVRDGNEVATLSPRFKTQTILTEHGPRDLILCATCGFMNAK